jgi:glycosyltransferase involved in cell wall biosynthesis
MRLLIITQKVDQNDPVLGFFVGWINLFAKNTECVTVICLEKGKYSLPENIKVFSLGKEQNVSRLSYILNFYRLIIGERENYDAVFVHMNPIYVVLGAPLWKILGKKISLWYSHKNVDIKLRVAAIWADIVFSTASESFTLATPKLSIVGHGIDVASFGGLIASKKEPLEILHVGRVTPIKNLLTLVEAAAHLKASWSKNFKVVLVGVPVTAADKDYKTLLQKKVHEYGLQENFEFKGAVLYTEIPLYYQHSWCSVNMAPTGGLDKSVLESMAAGVPVFVSNQAFLPYLGGYEDRLSFRNGDAKDLAQKIKAFFDTSDQQKVAQSLVRSVGERASIENLVHVILKKLS